MSRAIRVAKNNPAAPFGAVLVDVPSGEIISEGFNRTDENPILHGEIDAISKISAAAFNRWDRLRLYSTAEPCSMCQSAIIWSGIQKVVFGTSIQTLAQMGWKQFTITAEQVVALAPFASCTLIGGCLAGECDALFEKAIKTRHLKNKG